MSATAKLASCDERRALALQVADAVTKAAEARKKYEASKSGKTVNAGGGLYEALLQAQQVERDALRALREHIQQHECAV